MPHVGYCCGCVPCVPINFRVFDFVDGTLKWERLLINPLLATDGDVYAWKAGPRFAGYGGRFLAGSDGFITLPSRDGAGNAGVHHAEISFDRHSASTGAIVGNSGWYTTLPISAAAAENPAQVYRGDVYPSCHVVNGSGDMILNPDSSVPVISCVAGFPLSNSTTVASETTLYLDAVTFTAATMRLTLSGISPASDIVSSWAVGDSAATVQSALVASFGTYTSSITVSGDTLKTSGLVVRIEWDHDDAYISKFEQDYPSYWTGIGNVYLRNLRTGLIGKSVNSTGLGPGSSYPSRYVLGQSCWQDETHVWRVGARPNGDPLRMESWDTTSQPWTLVWSNEPFGTRVPVDDDITNMGVFWIASNGATNVISFPFTAGHGGFGSFMSALSWDAADGTNRIDYEVGTGDILTGLGPSKIAIEDGGDDISVVNQDWRDYGRWEEFATDALTQRIYGGNGNSWTRITVAATPAVVARLSRGDLADRFEFGFNDTLVAFADIANNRIEKNATSADYSHITIGPSPSGIYDPVTLEELRWHEISYGSLTRTHSAVASPTQWRYVWTRTVTPFTSIATKWFDFDADLSELNTELVTLLGNNADGNPNAVATDYGLTAPTGDVPLFQTGLGIRVYGAHRTANQSILETPALFTIVAYSSQTATSAMPDLTVEFQNLTHLRTATFGAIKQTDNTEEWALDWDSKPAPRVLACALHDSKLYVYGDTVCAAPTDYSA